MKPPRFVPRAAAFFAAAVVFFPRAASAWSANGHKTVGQIAQDLLKKEAGADPNGPAAKTLANIQSILGSDSGFTWSDQALANIAPCGDDIRAEPAAPGYPEVKVGQAVTCGGLSLTATNSAPWHFIDISIADPDTLDSVTATCAKANGACVVKAIHNSVDVLSGASTADSSGDPMYDKRVNLVYLAHFVGDEHQPLHCESQFDDPSKTGPNDPSDRGGNGKQVQFDGAVLNLHALWDHLIAVTDSNNDPATLSQTLEAKIPGDTSAWTQPGFIEQAAVESFGYAQNTIYKPFPDYPTVTKTIRGKPTTVSVLPSGGSGSDTASSASPRPRKPGRKTAESAGTAVGDAGSSEDYLAQMQPIVYERLEIAGVRLAALLKQALANQSLSAAVPPRPPAAGLSEKVKSGVREAIKSGPEQERED